MWQLQGSSTTRALHLQGRTSKMTKTFVSLQQALSVGHSLHTERRRAKALAGVCARAWSQQSVAALCGSCQAPPDRMLATREQ